MARVIEVCSTKRPQSKNEFYWHEVIKKKCWVGKIAPHQNVICLSFAYDTFAMAMKQAKAYNKRLAKKLEIVIQERK